MDGFLVMPSGKPIRRNPIHDILKIRSDMLFCIWERRKFTSVLRLHSGSHAYGVAAITTSVHKVSYDLQIKHSIAVHASALIISPVKTAGQNER